jgi:hypothetical protein
MATLNFSGTSAASAARTLGLMLIPFQLSAREKIRAAVIHGLINRLTIQNGFYNQFVKAFSESINIEMVKEFNSLSVTWGNENYTNNVSGGNSLGMYNKIAELNLHFFLKETEEMPMTILKERVIADIEKYFGTFYYIPDANGNFTAFNCCLEYNTPDGVGAYRPLGEVAMVLKVYYRTSLTDPRQLL